MNRILAMAVMFCVGSAQAATIFSEDYEVTNGPVLGTSGGIPTSPAGVALQAKGWPLIIGGNDIDGTAVMAIVPAPAGRTGSVLRMQYQGIHSVLVNGVWISDDGHNAKIIRNFPDAPEIYERYYTRYDPIDSSQPFGFTAITGKQHYLKTNVGTPNALTDFLFGNPRLGIVIQNPVFVSCPNGSLDTTCNINQFTQSVNMLNTGWHCVETHLKFNTPGVPDGVIEIWVDGTQTINYTAWRAREAGATAAAAFNNIEVYRQGSDNLYRYEDDHVMATTRIGCGTTPANSPPAAPRNLGIR